MTQYGVWQGQGLLIPSTPPKVLYNILQGSPLYSTYFHDLWSLDISIRHGDAFKFKQEEDLHQILRLAWSGPTARIRLAYLSVHGELFDFASNQRSMVGEHR